MATLTMGVSFPVFELRATEEKVARAQAGLTFSEKMNSLVRLGFALFHLTGAFRDVTLEQAKMIAIMQGPEIQALTREQYVQLAEGIEKIVESNSHIVSKARSIGFPGWESILTEIEDQSEHLAGIAETFRMACNEDELQILAELACGIDAGCFEATGETVGSMQA